MVATPLTVLPSSYPGR